MSVRELGGEWAAGKLSSPTSSSDGETPWDRSDDAILGFAAATAAEAATNSNRFGLPSSMLALVISAAVVAVVGVVLLALPGNRPQATGVTQANVGANAINDEDQVIAKTIGEVNQLLATFSCSSVDVIPGSKGTVHVNGFVATRAQQADLTKLLRSRVAGDKVTSSVSVLTPPFCGAVKTIEPFFADPQKGSNIRVTRSKS